MLRLTLRILVAVVVLPFAAAAGIALASLVAHSRASSWTPPDVKDELIPTPKPLAIPPLGGTARVKGTVLTEDGKPVGNATVRVSAGLVLLETQTQANGVFTAENLPSAPITFVVAAAGYKPELAGPLLPPKSEITIQLKVAERAEPPERAVNTGTGALTVLVSSETGAELPPLTVAAVPDTQDGREFALIPRVVDLTPAASPMAQLTGLPAGTYRVLVLPRGAPVDGKVAFHTARLDVLAGAEPKTVSYAIRWGEISGRVAHRGEPLTRAFVRVIRRAETAPSTGPLETREIELARGTTDAAGRFVFERLPVGESTLEILTTGFAPWSRVVSVGMEPSPLEIELSKEK
jgi:hypothetical protein